MKMAVKEADIAIKSDSPKSPKTYVIFYLDREKKAWIREANFNGASVKEFLMLSMAMHECMDYWYQKFKDEIIADEEEGKS